MAWLAVTTDTLLEVFCLKTLKQTMCDLHTTVPRFLYFPRFDGSLNSSHFFVASRVERGSLSICISDGEGFTFDTAISLPLQRSGFSQSSALYVLSRDGNLLVRPFWNSEELRVLIECTTLPAAIAACVSDDFSALLPQDVRQRLSSFLPLYWNA